MSEADPEYLIPDLNGATQKLGLPMLHEGELASHAAWNRALELLDALVPYPIVDDIGYAASGSVGTTEGSVYFVDGTGTADFANKNRCYALREGALWWFLPSSLAMLCVPLADAGTPIATPRPYQRTSVSSATWSIVS